MRKNQNKPNVENEKAKNEIKKNTGVLKVLGTSVKTVSAAMQFLLFVCGLLAIGGIVAACVAFWRYIGLIFGR